MLEEKRLENHDIYSGLELAGVPRVPGTVKRPEFNLDFNALN